MKIPEGTKRILTVCTGGKDRSPVMAEYFRGLEYEAMAVGISEYHTDQNGTQWLDAQCIWWADLIVCVSPTHEAFVRGLLRGINLSTLGDIELPQLNPPIRVVPELADETRGDDVREWVLGIMQKSFPAKE